MGAQRPAAALARTCSGLVAPAITEETTSWASSAPMATSIIGTPRSSAYPWRASSRSNCSARGDLRRARPAACPTAPARPRRYLPVSRPEASGKNGTKPMPSSSQAGSTSRSASRTSRLYSFWTAVNGVRPCSSATAAASRSWSASKLEAPIARTFPALDELVQGLERLEDRGDAVGLVVPVVVDHVGAQALQRRVDAMQDVLARATGPTAVAHVHSELGGQDHLSRRPWSTSPRYSSLWPRP